MVCAVRTRMETTTAASSSRNEAWKNRRSRRRRSNRGSMAVPGLEAVPAISAIHVIVDVRERAAIRSVAQIVGILKGFAHLLHVHADIGLVLAAADNRKQLAVRNDGVRTRDEQPQELEPRQAEGDGLIVPACLYAAERVENQPSDRFGGSLRSGGFGVLQLAAPPRHGLLELVKKVVGLEGFRKKIPRRHR